MQQPPPPAAPTSQLEPVLQTLQASSQAVETLADRPALSSSPLPASGSADNSVKPPDNDDNNEQSSIPPPPPNFQPFFTLLTSSSTSTTIKHPRTHYIFADDPSETNPITARVLETLEAPLNQSDDYDSSKGHDRGQAKEQDLVALNERYVIIDLDASGTKIVSAQSMSPNWAVMSTEIGPAPTWDVGAGNKSGQEEGTAAGGGMMLAIDGTECVGGYGPDTTESQSYRDDLEARSLEQLADEYERRMGDIRKVVEAFKQNDSGAALGDKA